MNCPQCGKEMEAGKVAYAFAPNGGLFWAPESYFRDRICSFSLKSVKKAGGIEIPVTQGVLQDFTAGYACKECGCVLIGCGGKNKETEEKEGFHL